MRAFVAEARTQLNPYWLLRDVTRTERELEAEFALVEDAESEHAESESPEQAAWLLFDSEFDRVAEQIAAAGHEAYQELYRIDDDADGNPRYDAQLRMRDGTPIPARTSLAELGDAAVDIAKTTFAELPPYWQWQNLTQARTALRLALAAQLAGVDLHDPGAVEFVAAQLQEHWTRTKVFEQQRGQVTDVAAEKLGPFDGLTPGEDLHPAERAKTSAAARLAVDSAIQLAAVTSAAVAPRPLDHTTWQQRRSS